VDDLQEVMLGVLEHHEDTFVFQDNLDELDDIRVTQLRAQGHFSDRGLRDAGVLDLFAFLVCFLISATRVDHGTEIPGLNFLMANSPVWP